MTTTYTSYDLIEFGQPLAARPRQLPTPRGSEVLLRVRRSGVCHSDIHIGAGYFNLGAEGELRMADRGMTLPVAMGHEIIGDVVARGADAAGIQEGARMLVYPWQGCGHCRACTDGRDNDCMKMRITGLVRDGGYATHVLVEHPRYLVDITGLDLDTTAPHACSGLTVYNALDAVGALRDGEWLAVFGAGGLGLNAIAIARARGVQRIVAVDVAEDKLAAARTMGAHETLAVDPQGAAEDAIDALRKICGGDLAAVIDTVGTPATSRLGVHTLIKTGRYVLVGLHGGDFTMPLPWLPQKAMTVRGCHVGSLAQLRALIDLVKGGGVRSLPVTLRPLAEVNGAFDDLKAGRVTGRIVLTND